MAKPQTGHRPSGSASGRPRRTTDSHAAIYEASTRRAARPGCMTGRLRISQPGSTLTTAPLAVGVFPARRPDPPRRRQVTAGHGARARRAWRAEPRPATASTAGLRFGSAPATRSVTPAAIDLRGGYSRRTLQSDAHGSSFAGRSDSLTVSFTGCIGLRWPSRPHGEPPPVGSPLESPLGPSTSRLAGNRALRLSVRSNPTRPFRFVMSYRPVGLRLVAMCTTL